MPITEHSNWAVVTLGERPTEQCPRAHRTFRRNGRVLVDALGLKTMVTCGLQRLATQSVLHKLEGEGCFSVSSVRGCVWHTKELRCSQWEIICQRLVLLQKDPRHRSFSGGSAKNSLDQTAGRSGRATRQILQRRIYIDSDSSTHCNLSCDIVILREPSVKKKNAMTHGGSGQLFRRAVATE